MAIVRLEVRAFAMSEYWVFMVLHWSLEYVNKTLWSLWIAHVGLCATATSNTFGILLAFLQYPS